MIDGNDLIGTDGWPDNENKVFIANSHIAWTNTTELYRMFVTEVRYGLFVVDFTWRAGRSEISLVHRSFLNLKEMLINESLPLPNGASFQSVSVLTESYDAKNQNWLIEVIVTVRNFHNLQVLMMIGPDYKILHSEIKHVYYRYNFYESTNYLKTFDGYFVTTQKIPPVYEGFDMYTKQLMVVYDSRPNRTEVEAPSRIGPSKIEASHMLGAIALPDLGRVTFDFNFTFRRNETDPFSNIGLVMVDARGVLLREITLSESLHIVTQPGIKSSQNIQLTARNDFSDVKLPITITIDSDLNPDGFPGWAIALIVIGSLALVAVGGYFGWKKWKSTQVAAEPEVQKNLLEQEADED